MSVIVTILDSVQWICFCHHIVDLVFKDFEIRILIESCTVDDFLGLKNSDSVFKHVIFLYENIRSCDGCWHSFFDFVHFLDPLLRYGELVFGFGQWKSESVFLLEQEFIVLDILFFAHVLVLVLNISENFELSFELYNYSLNFMLVHQAPLVSVSLISQNVFISVHKVTVELPVSVKLKANIVVLVFISLAHLCLLH